MLNKIYPIFVFFYAGLCYTQQAKNPVDYQQKKDSIDYFCERYESVYSVLSNLDSSLGTRLSGADSLFQIVIIEGEKLKREICFNYYCIDGCYNIKIPRSIFYKVSFGKWIEFAGYSQESDIRFNPSIDTIYETRFRNPSCVEVIDPPIYITDACSLHFSSEKSKKGEQIILINDTAYRIAKRKDGTMVLRKMD